MPLWKDYVNETWKQDRYFGMYPPTETISIGTFGTMKNRRFYPLGHLNDLEGMPELKLSPPTPVSQAIFQSESASSFTFNAETELQLPEMYGVETTLNAGISVRFADKKSLFVYMAGAQSVRLLNILEVMEHLRDRHSKSDAVNQGGWNDWYRVVTKLTRTKDLAVALSRSDDASIRLEFDGQPQISRVLGKAGFNMGWASQHNAVHTWMGSCPADGDEFFTPYFRCYNLNDRGVFGVSIEPSDD